MSRPLLLVVIVLLVLVALMVLLSTMATEVPTTRIETPVTNAQAAQ